MKTLSYFSRVTLSQITIISILLTSIVFLPACQKGDLNALSDETVISSFGLVSIKVSARGAVSANSGDPSLIMPINMVQQFDADGINESNEKAPVALNSKVNWSVSDQAIASIDGDGILTAKAAGTVTITAAFGSLPNSSPLEMTVSAGIASAVTVTVDDANAPSDSQIYVCQPTQLKAVLLYTDSSFSPNVTFDWDVTRQVSWKKTDLTDTATKIDDSVLGRIAYAPELALESTARVKINATFPGITEAGMLDLPVVDNPTRFATLLIEPGTLQLSPGNNRQLVTSTVNDSDQISDDITKFVTWDSSAPEVISVNDAGLVTGVSSSTTTTNITAKCNNKSKILSVNATEIHKLERVEITRDATRFYTIHKNANNGVTRKELEAKAYYSDNTQAEIINENSSPKKPTWSIKSLSTIAANSIADLNTTTGVIKANNTEGTVLVTLDFDGLSDDIVVVVEP